MHYEVVLAKVQIDAQDKTSKDESMNLLSQTS